VRRTLEDAGLPPVFKELEDDLVHGLDKLEKNGKVAG